MNLSPFGTGFGGNSSSSSSNLSALAPPFTVDRLNPNFNSSPLLRYPDSPYVVEPFNPAWQYARPSAPRPELVIDSTGETGVQLPDGYRFSASSASISPSTVHWSAPSPGTKASDSAFAYGGEINPYYSPYVPPLVDKDGTLIPSQRSHYHVVPTAGMSHTSQLDYTRSSTDLEYGPRWVDSLGFDDGKRAKRVELDGSFFSDKANAGGSCSYNQFDQGGYSAGTRNKSEEESDFSYQKFNQGYDSEFQSGAFNAGHVEDKHLGKDFCLFSNDSSKTNILESSSTYQESHRSIQSSERPKNISNYQSSYTPYEKGTRPDDTAFFFSSSAMRSSPTVVIRPPPTRGLSHKDLINFSKQGDSLAPSNSVEELSSALNSAGMFARKINTRFAQLPDLTVSDGSAVACDNVQVSNPVDVTTDFVDTHNLGVDSPCWKGAPYSKIPQFDVEAASTKGENNFAGCHGFGQEENQNVHPIVGSDRVSSEKTDQGNKNSQNEYARMDGGLELERTLGTICSSNEQCLLDDGRCHVHISTTASSKGVKIGADTDMLRKESGPPNNMIGYDMKDCSTKHLIDEDGAGTTPIYASEGGDVAVHAAEKVLDSPASQDAAAEDPKLPDPKLNVPTMIKAMHNLSELLLFHVSNHADSIDGEHTETLKHIISNLDLCLSRKIIQASDKPAPKKPVGDTSEKLGDSCDVGTISMSHTTNETVNSNIKLHYGSTHEGGGNFSISGESDNNQDKKLPKFSRFMDDLDMTRDDDTTKAIKRVLEENFHFDEEMYSQALLFKSLWLEAEAKLCSISYKAHFDRMKILMEEAKLKAPQVTVSEAPLKAHAVTMSGHADDIEASVMERLNILKSREENPKPVSVEEEHQLEMVDGEHAPSVMARFNVLKSCEGNSKLVSVQEDEEEEQEPYTVVGEHATSVMTRFNILKSREDNSKPVSVREEQQCEAVDGVFPGGKYAMQFIGSQSEKETLNVPRTPDFCYQIGSFDLDAGKFGSFVDESHLSVKNGPIIHSLNSSNITSQDNSGLRDSSSDWEHVLKDEVSWKNL